MVHCLICNELLLKEQTLELGSLAICNQFEKQPVAQKLLHLLSLTECPSCHLVQLTEFPAAVMIRPRQSWIRYNEPSAHLDTVVEQLMSFFPAQQAYSAMGVGPFDHPLLERLKQSGVTYKQLDVMSYLPEDAGQYPYLESIQAVLRNAALKELASLQGRSYFVSCRYLLEHSHAPIESLQSLGHLLTEDGLLLIEVPDSSKFLVARDYSFIWEEHICYFTEDTFKACAQRAGYDVIQFTRYPGALEDLLVFVLRVAKHPFEQDLAPRNLTNSATFTRYKADFANIRTQYGTALQTISESGNKIAIFGAGHQSIMFINALGLSKFISYAIDDAPEKTGYFIPGTSIPIVLSDHLLSDTSINVCLLGVGPQIEAKIRHKCAGFLDRGGRMYSIFPGAGRATLVDA
jgi:C-methyltransferase C-terminal domain/Methyltransferase domain